MDNILSLKNVNKKYEGFCLDDVSFSLKKGYIMGLIGPNGAGKTTTIKLIMNLIKKDSGQIEIFGLDSAKSEKEIKRDIGFIFSENHFWEELAIKEIHSFSKRFYPSWDAETFDAYIKKFNLPASKKIKQLSKGMQIKFSIALAISHNPKLLIMDEPTSGLDPIFRRELLDILLEIMQDEEKSVFFSTHITADLEKVADYITFINDGKVIFSDEKDSVMERYHVVKGSNEVFSSGSSVSDLFLGIKRNRFGFEALTDNISDVKNILEGNIHIEKASLEDIMFYTGRGDMDA